MKTIKGSFITFEGSEGCGKSTQVQLLVAYLRSRNIDARSLREPGGVVISEKIRNIILDTAHTAMSRECETLLYMAARAQVVEELILPELEAGRFLVCDRFLDSTIAYQGFGCGIDITMIHTIGQFATRGVSPDLTFFLDLDVNEGLRRRGSERDRIEQRSLEYHERVRQGYLQLSKKDPKRIIVIDASQSREIVFENIRKHIDALLEHKA